MDIKKIILVVGLGNPGTQYAMTRHNAGFIAVDSFAGGNTTWKKEKNALTVSGTWESDGRAQRVIFAKPQTYMNNSGTVVLALMTFYKIPIDNLIVIHDEMDIKPGEVKIKIGGGSAGHNGIRSIDATIGKEYKRIRIGIGHPRDIELMIDPSDWVLGKFTKPELEKITNIISNLEIIK